MNFLAHTVFARQDPELIVGQFCGDFLRGSRLEDFAPNIQAGIIMHRKIDSFTDQHPVNLEARRHFVKPYRRYAGILTDVVYDHYLARDWSVFSEVPLDQHIRQVHQALEQHFELLPRSLQGFARYMIEHDLLASYRQFDAVDVALRRIAGRSPKFLPLAQAGPLVQSLDASLSDCFKRFYPDLQSYVSSLERLS